MSAHTRSPTVPLLPGKDEHDDATHTKSHTSPNNTTLHSSDRSALAARDSASDNDGRPGRLSLLFFALIFPSLVLIVAAPIGLFVIGLKDANSLYESSSRRILWSSYVFYTAVFTLVMCVFVMRLRYHPLRARSPLFLIISSMAGFALVSWINISAYKESFTLMSCTSIHFLINIGYPAFVLPYFFRAYRLWFCFHLSEETFSGHNEFGSESHRVTQAYMLRWFVAIMMLFVGISMLDLFTKADVFPICHTRLAVFSGFWITAHVIEVLAFLWILYALRNVWDAYSIRTELQLACVITTITAAVLITFQSVHISIAKPETLGATKAGEIGLIVSARLISMFAISVVWPLYRTWFKPNVVFQWPNKEVLASLEQVLSNPQALPFFQQFVVSEVNADPLKFWMEVELFRDMEDDRWAGPLNHSPWDLRKRALLISKMYVESRRIPVSDACVARIHARIGAHESIRVDLFDAAQEEIYVLMESTSYPRFLQSSLCKELLVNMESQGRVIDRLINSQVI